MCEDADRQPAGLFPSSRTAISDSGREGSALANRLRSLIKKRVEQVDIADLDALIRYSDRRADHGGEEPGVSPLAEESTSSTRVSLTENQLPSIRT
jgi:hypothetical protein